MIVGIDPGSKGGIALMDGDGQIFDVFPMPTIKDGRETTDCKAVIAVLEPILRSVELVVLEKVHSMPKDGVVGAFSFGRSFGRLEGILAALSLPSEFPAPQTWKAVILKGTDKSKDAAVSHVQKRWPSVRLVRPPKRKPHDGMADAILIAEYGRRILHGGGS